MINWDPSAMEGYKNYKDALKLQNDGIYNAKEIGDIMKSVL